MFMYKKKSRRQVKLLLDLYKHFSPYLLTEVSPISISCVSDES